MENSKGKQNEVITEIDGIKYALEDVLLGVQVSLKRLSDLEKIISDKQEDTF